MYKPDDMETILAELEAGIIPTSIFMKNLCFGKDSFKTMSKEEARKAKRKWRKLKRKLQVNRTGISQAAFTVRVFLRKNAEEEIFR